MVAYQICNGGFPNLQPWLSKFCDLSNFEIVAIAQELLPQLHIYGKITHLLQSQIFMKISDSLLYEKI